jgi:hypothetical protein
MLFFFFFKFNTLIYICFQGVDLMITIIFLQLIYFQKKKCNVFMSGFYRMRHQEVKPFEHFKNFVRLFSRMHEQPFCILGSKLLVTSN